MQIVFMGSAEFAVPTLEALKNAGHNIECVISQPDKPAGRGQRLTPPPVARRASELGLNLYQPKTVKSEKVIEKIRSFKPDVIIVVAYGKILPNSLLNIPDLGCVNLHSSLLPKYRGAAPINWAIVNGEAETGVTTMFISEELDAGDILMQRSIRIEDNDTSITVHDKLAKLGACLVIETIEGLKTGVLKPISQDKTKATLAPILKKEDGEINWNKDAISIRNLIRGMQPWPSAHTLLDGKALKIFGALVVDRINVEMPGTIISAENALIVSTGAGELKLGDIQIEGKKRMKASEFLRGHKIKPGTKLG